MCAKIVQNYENEEESLKNPPYHQRRMALNEKIFGDYMKIFVPRIEHKSTPIYHKWVVASDEWL